jgi:hypothetical protein
VGQRPGPLADRPPGGGATVHAIAQRGEQDGGLEIESVLGALKQPRRGQPAPGRTDDPVHHREGGADGEELIVFADRVSQQRAVQRPVEPAARLAIPAGQQP